MVTTRQMRVWWADWRCLRGPMQKITMLGRYAGTVAAPMYDAFKAAEMALVANRYTGVQSLWIPRQCPTGIGGKTCQSDGTNCSIHNYGVAFDIDPFKYGNPFFHKRYGDGWDFSSCKITSGQVAAVEGIKNVQGEQMFRWLGWAIGDTMHVEGQVPPDRCEVDWKTVPGDPVDPPPEEGDGMFLPLKKNDVGEDVRFLQDRLNLTYGSSLKLDGDYGPAVVEVVKDNIGQYTGNQAGKDGLWVGGKQWSRMSLDFAKKYGEGAKGEQGDPGEDGKDATLTIKGDVTLP